MNTHASVAHEQAEEISRKLLDEVAKEPTVSQRVLADRLGIALGLVNAYVKRLCAKGHLKITTLPRNRIKYLITPQGFTEKARLTYSYMNISLNYFKDSRRRIEVLYAELLSRKYRRILLWGDGEIAELCYISTRGLSLEIVGAVSKSSNGHDFFGKPVVSPDQAADIECDVVLIASHDSEFNSLAYTYLDGRRDICLLDAGGLS